MKGKDDGLTPLSWLAKQLGERKARQVWAALQQRANRTRHEAIWINRFGGVFLETKGGPDDGIDKA